jgi:hypothetical protein
MYPLRHLKERNASGIALCAAAVEPAFQDREKG